jgi:hypothetical protein
LYSSSNNNPTISNCSAYVGGGAYLYSSSNNTLSISSCSASSGGGCYSIDSSNNTLTISNCSAGYGGGCYLGGSSNNNLTISNCSADGYGGGCYLGGSSNNNLTISNCSADDYGGGCYLDSSSNNTLTISNCSAYVGGGAYLDSSSNNTLTISNCSSNYVGQGLHLQGGENNEIKNYESKDGTNDISYYSGTYYIHGIVKILNIFVSMSIFDDEPRTFSWNASDSNPMREITNELLTTTDYQIYTFQNRYKLGTTKVYVDGVRVYKDKDYIEIDDTHIRFNNPLDPNDEVRADYLLRWQ